MTDKSIDFAIRMAKCYQYLMNDRQEFIMSKQMFVIAIIAHILQKEKRKLFGHPNDQKIFATPVAARFLSLLSVIKYR